MQYLGNKNKLLKVIWDVIESNEIRGGVFFDLFAGTGTVGASAKKRGYQVISSDLLYLSYILQRTYIGLNEYPQFTKILEFLKLIPERNQDLGFTMTTSTNDAASCVIKYLNTIEEVEGFLFREYSEEGSASGPFKRKYFYGHTAKRIDAIRLKIREWVEIGLLSVDEECFLLASLIEATSEIGNSCGHFSYFLDKEGEKSFNEMELLVPHLNTQELTESGKAYQHYAYQGDGLKLLTKLPEMFPQGVDVLYLDPPYNGAQYSRNYHVIETIAKYDYPELYNQTGMRPDIASISSSFCNEEDAYEGLRDILEIGGFKHLLLSYNSEGVMKHEKIMDILSMCGEVDCVKEKYKRYVTNQAAKATAGKVYEKVYYLKTR